VCFLRIVLKLDALGASTAVIAGHDWGSVVAWQAAQLRPDRFTAVIALADPYRPQSAVRPTTAMPETEEAMFYMLYFQEPGVAEAEYEADIPGNLLKNFHRTSGEVVGRKQIIGAGGVNMVRKGGGFLTEHPFQALRLTG
jgi:pimeloyl-ACP methyl ester carboxylesterase